MKRLVYFTVLVVVIYACLKKYTQFAHGNDLDQCTEDNRGLQQTVDRLSSGKGKLKKQNHELANKLEICNEARIRVQEERDATAIRLGQMEKIAPGQDSFVVKKHEWDEKFDRMLKCKDDTTKEVRDCGEQQNWSKNLYVVFCAFLVLLSGAIGGAIGFKLGQSQPSLNTSLLEEKSRQGDKSEPGSSHWQIVVNQTQNHFDDDTMKESKKSSSGSVKHRTPRVVEVPDDTTGADESDDDPEKTRGRVLPPIEEIGE